MSYGPSWVCNRILDSAVCLAVEIGMILHDWFDWSNAGVGSVGLLLTIAAIVQATGAKTAAENAGKSVRRHTAEVDFGTLSRLAKELHSYVEDGKLAEARLRTTDLRSELALAIGHYKIPRSSFRPIE